MINWIPSLTWHLSFTHYPQHCSVENPCCSGPDSCFKHCLHHHHRNFSLPNWSLCLVLTLLLAAYPPENTIPPKSAHRHLITGGLKFPTFFPCPQRTPTFPTSEFPAILPQFASTFNPSWAAIFSFHKSCHSKATFCEVSEIKISLYGPPPRVRGTCLMPQSCGKKLKNWW